VPGAGIGSGLSGLFGLSGLSGSGVSSGPTISALSPQHFLIDAPLTAHQRSISHVTGENR